MQQVAEAVPRELQREIIIVGSLAAAYHFFGQDPGGEITTKDVDGMLSPNAHAIRNARAIAERRLEAGWTLKRDPKWGILGDASTPVDELPILRMHPPGNTDWVLELAAAPPAGSSAPKMFERVSTARGDFALHSFRFLGLAEEDPLESDFGILYARPEMMALANLLHHPRIGPELIAGTEEKRSNKDLGRVFALAWLATARNVMHSRSGICAGSRPCRAAFARNGQNSPSVPVTVCAFSWRTSTSWISMRPRAWAT
jgi:hypothetical protein